MPATPSFYSRVFTLAVAAILGLALLKIFTPFALPMIWAAFLAFLLFPVNLRLRRRFKGKSLSAGVLTFFGAHCHLAAVERLVDRVCVANFRIAAPGSKIGDGYGHPIIFRFAAIPLDRPDQYLAAGRAPIFPPSNCNPGWFPAHAR